MTIYQLFHQLPSELHLTVKNIIPIPTGQLTIFSNNIQFLLQQPPTNL